jgi:zinc transporter, ZIP family
MYMGAAFGWGIVGASSLLLGGVLALTVHISLRALGLLMGFGAGVLISAVAYELVEEAFEVAGGGSTVAIGMLAGAVTFAGGDAALDRWGARDRKRSDGRQMAAAGASGLAITLGIVLDGVPESAVLGLTLLDGGGVGIAMLAAVFISNLPEAVAASTGLRAGGWSGRRVMLLWLAVALVSGLAAAVGYQLAESASLKTVALINSFAAGAILTMLADTMMPEAFEHGGRLVGLVTTVGFLTAFALAAMD